MNNLKLTKNIIKDIVKECLVEILSEGLLADSSQRKTTSRNKSIQEVASSHRSKPTRKKTKNNPSSGLQNKKNTKLNELAMSLTEDPVMADMLLDTANTTLQEQISAESRKNSLSLPPGAGDKAQKVVDSSSPEELFGADTSGKWAHLAFGG